MENLKNILKKTGSISLLESISFAIIGIVLIKNPEGTINFISTLIGVVFIFFGAYKLFLQLINKEKGNVYENGIVFGIMSIVIGIVIMVFGKEISKIFSIIIGIWVIYSAILRISSSIKLKTISQNSKIWIFSLVLSVIMLICGIYIVANSTALVASIGVFILVYSIIDIIENLIFLSNLK